MQSDKHISKSFDQDLDEAIRLFLDMGDSAANQVAKAIHALIDKNETLAQEVIDMDFDINRMEVELDEHIYYWSPNVSQPPVIYAWSCPSVKAWLI